MREDTNDIENTITNTNTGGKYKYKYRCDLGQWERMGDGVEALVRVAPFLPLLISTLYKYKYKYIYRYMYKYKYKDRFDLA